MLTRNMRNLADKLRQPCSGFDRLFERANDELICREPNSLGNDLNLGHQG
jgi:hypothetical protein